MDIKSPVFSKGGTTLPLVFLIRDYRRLTNMSFYELLLLCPNIFLSVGVVPTTIYDRETGQYKGFANIPTVFWLLVAAVAAWLVILASEAPRVAPWQYSIMSIVLVALGARFVVEGLHEHLHGTWLHKEGIWLLPKKADAGDQSSSS